MKNALSKHLAARKLEACVNFISSRFTSAPTLRLGIFDFTVGAGKESAREHLADRLPKATRRIAFESLPWPKGRNFILNVLVRIGSY
jgi:hypothetical protein